MTVCLVRVCTTDGKKNLIKRGIKGLIPLELHLHEVGTRGKPNRRNAAVNTDLIHKHCSGHAIR